MTRDLFVFAGQSNMMGAAALPPERELNIRNSFEYKHKPRRFGGKVGEFVSPGYPVGEFSYVDKISAYAEGSVNERGESRIANYLESTYFCPSMANLKSREGKEVYPFSRFSEAEITGGVSLAPILCEEWEALGGSCAYTHIAKGCVDIGYYLTGEMHDEYSRRISEYNLANGTEYSTDGKSKFYINGAADYFFEKCRNFFADAERRFHEDSLGNRCFFWLQGESDAGFAEIEYETKLDILWDRLKRAGFTHFFCIRVDYFGKTSIDRIMRAQESFVSSHGGAYMLTRAASYMVCPGQNEDEWFISPPSDEYRGCRDSCFGYENNHINEKGFSVIAKRSAQNLYRVLVLNEAPALEEENVRSLLG